MMDEYDSGLSSIIIVRTSLARRFSPRPHGSWRVQSTTLHQHGWQVRRRNVSSRSISHSICPTQIGTAMEPNEKVGASWWREMLTRREANGRIAKLSLTAVLLAAVGITEGCGSDDAEVERDALELQQKEGWNIGSTDKPL